MTQCTFPHIGLQPKQAGCALVASFARLESLSTKSILAARDHPHLGFMWPVGMLKSNGWAKELDTRRGRRLMWQLEIVRMTSDKSHGFSHSLAPSLITLPSPSSPSFWRTGPPHSAPGYTYRDVTLVRIPPSVAQQSGTRVILTDRRARLPIHVPPLQMRDMTVYWWSHIANKTAQQK